MCFCIFSSLRLDINPCFLNIKSANRCSICLNVITVRLDCRLWLVTVVNRICVIPLHVTHYCPLLVCCLGSLSMCLLQSYLWIHLLPGCLFQQLQSSERCHWAPSSAQYSGRDTHESWWLWWRQDEKHTERGILTYFLVTETVGDCTALLNQTTQWLYLKRKREERP